MNIMVNGKSVNFTKHSVITDLLTQLELNPETVIVEKNKELIPSSDFPTTTLSENDTLELLHFVGGG